MTEPAKKRGGPLAVIMGVAGCGKSTVGPVLAERYDVQFRDADEFHPQANKDKMHAGHPLTDEDRKPWLDAISVWLDEHAEAGTIVTCSALKRRYRDQLRVRDASLPFLHLVGPMAVAVERVGSRTDHFMPASLVENQYTTLEPLEPDEIGITADFTHPVDQIVAQFAAFLDSLTTKGN